MAVFLTVFWVELKVYFRNPLALFWTFIFPFLLLFIFMEFKVKAPGVVKVVSINIIDMDKTTQSEKFVAYISEKIMETEIISVNIGVSGALLKSADVNLTLSKGFSDFVDAKTRQKVIVEYGQYSPWQVHAAAGIIKSAADGFYMSELRIINPIDVTKLASVKVLSFNEKELSAQQFLVSGLLAMVIFSNSLLGISGLIVQRRNTNSYRMQMISPIKVTHYMTAYALSRILIHSSISLIFILVSDYLFDLNINYSFALVFGFMATVLLGSLSFFMISLALVSRVRNVNASTGINNLVYFPLLFSSNIFFPLVTDSSFINKTIDFFPLANFVELLRGCLFYSYSFLESLTLVLNLVAWLIAGVMVTKLFFRWNFSD